MPKLMYGKLNKHRHLLLVKLEYFPPKAELANQRGCPSRHYNVEMLFFGAGWAIEDYDRHGVWESQICTPQGSRDGWGEVNPQGC